MSTKLVKKVNGKQRTVTALKPSTVTRLKSEGYQVVEPKKSEGEK